MSSVEKLEKLRNILQNNVLPKKKKRKNKEQQGHVDSDFTEDDESDDLENGDDLELDMEKMMEGAEDSENVQTNDNAVEINNNDGNVQNTNDDLNIDDTKVNINEEKELPGSNHSDVNVQRTNNALNNVKVNKEKEVFESDGDVQKNVTDINVTKAGKGGIKIEEVASIQVP